MQRKEEKRGNYHEEILEGIRMRLREEINMEDRGILKLRKKAHDKELPIWKCWRGTKDDAWKEKGWYGDYRGL